jgi:hypothetical protein
MNFLLSTLSIAAAVLISSPVQAWSIFGSWDDGDDIVMDDVMLPAATFSSPAQSQMSDYNRIDTTDNSHPFRINLAPEFSFGSNDGDNTIGGLGAAGLNSEYGLSYASALAWTVSSGSGSDLDECDIMLDPTLAWNLGPDNSTWFQSTVLHELGHCRGLDHYNGFQSMQNSAQSKYLRNEVLYMDDKDAIRQNSSTVTERDIAIYHKWHDGTRPQWMTMSPTTLRVGDSIDFNNVTAENRGSQAFGSDVEVAFYLSENMTITTFDSHMTTASWASFGTFTFSTFDITTTIPEVEDCGTYYAGAIVDPDDDWSERFEGNNSAVMTNGVAFTGTTFTPTSLDISLEEDADEPNDSRSWATPIPLPFSATNLTIDQDSESDFYEFTLTEERKIRLLAMFDDSNGDIDIQLQNGFGAVLASSSTSDDSELIMEVLDAGTYYLRVFGDGSGSCNRYELLALASDPSCGLGFEAGLIVPAIFMLRGRLRKRGQARGAMKA